MGVCRSASKKLKKERGLQKKSRFAHCDYLGYFFDTVDVYMLFFIAMNFLLI